MIRLKIRITNYTDLLFIRDLHLCSNLPDTVYSNLLLTRAWWYLLCKRLGVTTRLCFADLALIIVSEALGLVSKKAPNSSARKRQWHAKFSMPICLK